MRHINGEKLDDAKIYHFKNKIRASSIRYFIDIMPHFIKSENISTVHRQQCKMFLEGQKASSKIDRIILDAGLKIWRIPSFQDYLQEFISSEVLSDESSIETPVSFEPDQIHVKERSTTMTKIHSDNPAKRFLNCFDKIVAEGYIPNLEDILNLRIPTTGNLSLCLVYILR